MIDNLWIAICINFIVTLITALKTMQLSKDLTHAELALAKMIHTSIGLTSKLDVLEKINCERK